MCAEAGETAMARPQERLVMPLRGVARFGSPDSETCIEFSQRWDCDTVL